MRHERMGLTMWDDYLVRSSCSWKMSTIMGVTRTDSDAPMPCMTRATRSTCKGMDFADVR